MVTLVEAPPYTVPSMAEVRATPTPFIGVSTFSGAGGSSTGMRMAGVKMLWANEFVPAARDTYRANWPTTTLCADDVRAVNAETILSTIGLERGQLDVLEGSPPCASFSTAGLVSKGWGEAHVYSGKTQRTDDLFYEFVRLLDELQPRVFVAENVSGLVKGKSKGVFLQVLAALKGCGYDVRAQKLDASWLGVPQARERMIFIGVRSDLGVRPKFPTPLPYRYTLRDVLTEDVAPERDGDRFVDQETGTDLSIKPFSQYAYWLRKAPDSRTPLPSNRYFLLRRCLMDQPAFTVTAKGDVAASAITHPYEPRKFTLAELRRICGFPADYVLTGRYAHRWERLGRSVPPVMMAAIGRCVVETLEECS